jgi:copper(I)-binding protein
MKRILRLLAACGLVHMLVAVPAFAQPSPVAVQGAWARATTPGVATGGIYVTLTSQAGDRLVGASSPVAAKADVHEMQMDGTIMRMRILPNGLDLPAGRAVTLSPSGTHIMLEGLKSPLRQGSTVPVHLVFQTAPPVDIQATVQSIGAAGPSAMPSMSMPK